MKTLKLLLCAALLALAVRAVASTGTVLVGQSVTFSVTADGTQPFSYQWSKDGAVIAGATGETYNIGAVKLADAGNFSAVVSNSAGSTTSDLATLIVNQGVAFTTQPAGQVVTVGAAVTFTAVVTGSPAPTYQWMKNGAAIAGATSATYTIAAAAVADSGTYTVVATNVVGSLTSAAAVLVVNPVVIPSHAVTTITSP